MPNTRLLHLQSPQADKRDRGLAARPMPRPELRFRVDQ